MGLEFNRRTIVSIISAVCLYGSIGNAILYSQEVESEVAQSMGVGMKSRFASGATPIQIERTEIVPGTPMSVNSTMNNIMSSNGNNSFGGILSRYDTSTFGKFFGVGTMAAHANNSRITDLDNLEQGDNEVDNIETERMYPPRLVLDFKEFPTRSLEVKSVQNNIQAQVENAISRFDIDRQVESIQIECQGDVVYLRGQAKSARMVRLLENIVSLQAGVNSVVNEIKVLEKETNKVDVFGRPIEENYDFDDE